MAHDADRVEKDLFDGLSQDAKHTAVLLGAGCPAAISKNAHGAPHIPLMPDIAGLTKNICAALHADVALPAILAHFHDEGAPPPNIEAILTHVRAVSRVVGKAGFRGVATDSLLALERQICLEIANEVIAPLPRRGTAYHALARWAGTIRRSVPISLFTTNYDLLMEQALEEEDVAFFDGFVGAREPFLDTVAIEEEPLPPRWTRLWKLHGSINWRLTGNRTTRVPGPPAGPADVLLIHPSDRKYDESRRMPYLLMIDRLREFLRRPGALMITCGFSFGDQHLNEVVFQSLRSNPSAAVFGLLFGDLARYEPLALGSAAGNLPSNLMLLAADGAIIKRRREEWAPTDDPAGGAPKPRTFPLGDFATFGLLLETIVARQR